MTTNKQDKISVEKIKNVFAAELPDIQVDIDMEEGLFFNNFFMYSCIFDIDIFDPEVEGDDEEVDEILQVCATVFDEVFLNIIDPDEGNVHLFGLIMFFDEEDEE